MPIDPLQYADIYPDVREFLLPGIRRTGADPADPDKATYAVYTVSFDERTGQPLEAEVVGVSQAGVLAQIAAWEAEIIAIQKRIDNALLFLEDAGKAELAEVLVEEDPKS